MPTSAPNRAVHPGTANHCNPASKGPWGRRLYEFEPHAPRRRAFVVSSAYSGVGRSVREVESMQTALVSTAMIVGVVWAGLVGDAAPQSILGLSNTSIQVASIENVGYRRRYYRRYGYPVPYAYYPPGYGFYPPPPAYAYPPAYNVYPPPPVNGEYQTEDGGYGSYPPVGGDDDYPPPSGY